MEEMSSQDPNCEDMQRKDQRLPFQIFPDPVEVVLGPETSLNSHDHEKERLPSIVVEPTEVSEVESGELRWPPDNMDMDEDEEDLFLEQCIPPANIADWGDEEEEEEETSVILNQQPGLTLIGTALSVHSGLQNSKIFSQMHLEMTLRHFHQAVLQPSTNITSDDPESKTF